jgi:hypothetical protein
MKSLLKMTAEISEKNVLSSGATPLVYLLASVSANERGLVECGAGGGSHLRGPNDRHGACNLSLYIKQPFRAENRFLRALLLAN